MSYSLNCSLSGIWNRKLQNLLSYDMIIKWFITREWSKELEHSYKPEQKSARLFKEGDRNMKRAKAEEKNNYREMEK